MSTRCSIYYEDGTHLFWDSACDLKKDGLHLSFHPTPSDSDYGSFEVEYSDSGKFGSMALEDVDPNSVGVAIRIPWDVCEAIAKYVKDST